MQSAEGGFTLKSKNFHFVGNAKAWWGIGIHSFVGNEATVLCGCHGKF